MGGRRHEGELARCEPTAGQSDFHFEIVVFSGTSAPNWRFGSPTLSIFDFSILDLCLLTLWGQSDVSMPQAMREFNSTSPKCGSICACFCSSEGLRVTEI